MQTEPNESISSFNELIKSFNTSDSVYALQSVDGDGDGGVGDGDIDNVRSDTNVDYEDRPPKNKYWKIVKNQIPVAFFFSKKNKSKTEKKNVKAQKKSRKAKSTSNQRSVVYLSEKDWFIKKFQREVGEPNNESMVPFSTLEKDLRSRVGKWQKENRLYREYNEPPRSEDVPDIVWDGPPLKSCLCISPMEDSDCKGDMVLPPRFIPIAIPMRLLIILRYLERIDYIKKLRLPVLRKYEKPFAQRLQEHLEVEAAVQNQLKEMDLQRGPEFCIYRCYHYRVPKGHQSGRYFKLKRELYKAYKKKEPVKVVVVTPPKRGPRISDEFIDGFYRSVSTQARTDENGEFVMGKVTRILFGRGDASVLQDIEGTPYCVCSYQDVVKKKSETVVKKLENLLSISGIKKRVSKLTSSLMTSIVEINDPGIPSNTRATQDPSLDDYVESVIVPSIYKFVKDIKEEVCPCCKKYKEIQAAETERIESNVIDNYDDLIAKDIDSPLNILFPGMELKSFINDGLKETENLTKASSYKENVIYEKFQKHNLDDNLQVQGKQIAPKKDNNLKDKENESELKNIDDNTELMKRRLITDKLLKKYKSLDKDKDLYAIQSESMLNVEENKSEQKTTKPTTDLNKDIHKVAIGETKIILEDDLAKTDDENGDKAERESEKGYNVAFKGTAKNNNQMKGLEFLESIKPCCIDNLYKELGKKISRERCITKLLNQILKRVDRRICSIEKKRLQEIKNEKNNPLTSNEEGIEDIISDNIDLGLDEAQKSVQIRTKDSKGVKLSKINKSLKSSINKFSDFIKKQKSSIKIVFTKNIEEVKLKSKSRNAFSLEDFKLKISKSLKKMNNRLSSFFKRNDKKSSNDINQFRPEQDSDKMGSLDDSGSKVADSSNIQLQNVPEIHDSKTSEKEVFSVQYNSTCEFYSKNTKQ